MLIPIPLAPRQCCIEMEALLQYDKPVQSLYSLAMDMERCPPELRASFSSRGVRQGLCAALSNIARGSVIKPPVAADQI